MPQLDGLRAVAVFLVFIHHWTNLHLDTGQLGVQLFFVLSGFLITGILLDLRGNSADVGQSKMVSLRQFYGRRFLRIFPLFYGTILLLYIFDLALIREVIGWHVTYLSNVGFALNGEFIGRTSHFWTLAVEEQFYLVWPLIILSVPRRALLPTIAAAIILAPLARSAFYLSGNSTFVTYNLWPVSNLDTLGFGGLLALLIRREDWPAVWLPKMKYLLALGLVVYAGIQLTNWAGTLEAISMFRQTALALILGWVIIRAADGFGGLVGSFLEWKPILYLGQISYGLYVFHNFAPDVLRRVAGFLGYEPLDVGLLRFVLSFILTVTVSAASWHSFEKPINRLKSHIPYIVQPSTAGASEQSR